MAQVNIVEGIPTQQELEQMSQGKVPFRRFTFKLVDGQIIEFAPRSMRSVQSLTYGGWSVAGQVGAKRVSGYLNTHHKAGYLIIPE